MASADRLIQVFNDAKARPAGPERDQYLTAACHDDAELQEQVLSLLQAHESAGPFLQSPAAVSTEMELELARLKPEQAGEQIGLYKLREQIGEGGFGVVWVAEQQVPVRRMLALKIIKLGMDTREVVARFEQERQALAMMDHPNIAKVFDAGATEHGRPFFVMELVRGIKITDYCDQVNLPTAERLALFTQVCHAVQHAHQKGIIHRDLKPSNILVTLHDGRPVPKIIDFGVAKATQGQLGDFSIYTQFQQMIGTPLYMSPEQAEMSALDVDTRTDIYALGVLLYELLTGRTPFDAEALLQAGYDEMRRIIREQEPQKPSTALHSMAHAKLTSVAHHRSSEPPKLIHAVHGDLDWIVMKALEKDRVRRYETANGLAADIQRHLQNEPVAARPASASYRFRRLVRRNKLAFAAGVAIAVALVAGFTTSTWMYFRESDARKRAAGAEQLAVARLKEVSAERDAKEVARQEAEAISTFLTEVFQSPAPARDGRTITVAETLDRAARKLEADLADQPARRAGLQTTLGNTYSALGLHREAIPLLEKVLEYHRTTSGPVHPDTLWAMHNLAIPYFASGRRDEALKLGEEMLAGRRKALGPEHLDTLKAMTNLANSYTFARRRDEALHLREEVLAVRRKVLGPKDPQTLAAMESVASSYYASGRRDEALKMREEVMELCREGTGSKYPYQLAAASLADSYAAASRRDEALHLRENVMQIRLKLLGQEHPDTIWAMAALADSYHAVGQRRNALGMRDEVLELRRKVLGREHPDTITALHALAYSYADAGKPDDALWLREEALTLCRRVLGPEDPGTLQAMHNLAISYQQAGRKDDALKMREEVLTLRRAVLGPEDPDTLWAMHNLAISYNQTGRHDEALRIGEEVLTLRRRVLGPEDPNTLWAMNNLATSYDAAGRQDEALRMREEVLTLRRKVLGPDHPDTLRAMNILANAYRANGDIAKADSLEAEIAVITTKAQPPAKQP